MDGIGENGMLLPSNVEQFKSNFQAYYYLFNAKPDCKTIVFNKKISVGFDDIKKLNNMVMDKIRNHHIKEEDIALFGINIAYEDSTSISFESWKSFECADVDSYHAVKSVSIVWEFTIKLDLYEFPQRHRLRVKISNGMNSQDFFSLLVSGKLDEVEEIDFDSPVVAKVDFINALIGNELLDIVSKWVDHSSVFVDESSKIMDLMKVHNRRVAYMLNYVTTFVVVFCLYKVLMDRINALEVESLALIGIPELAMGLSLLFWGVIACLFVNKISFYFADNIFKVLMAYGESHVFKITKGDSNRLEKLKASKAKQIAKITKNAIITLAINVICAIITTVLLNY